MHCLSTIKKLHDELATRHSDNEVISLTKTEDEAYEEGLRQGSRSKFTVQQVIRWSTDIFGYEFASEIYGRSVEDWHTDNYVAGKFKHMQRDIIGWMANLDPQNQEKLARSIVSHSDEDGNIKTNSPLTWGKK